MRPGEKLFEELFADGEHYRPTSHDKLFIADGANSQAPTDLMHAIAQLEQGVANDSEPDLLWLIQQLVPEYHGSIPVPVRAETQEQAVSVGMSNAMLP